MMGYIIAGLVGCVLTLVVLLLGIVLGVMLWESKAYREGKR